MVLDHHGRSAATHAPDDGGGARDLALGVDQLRGVEQRPALVTLIPARVLRGAKSGHA
jgi:hypothetical protein